MKIVRFISLKISLTFFRRHQYALMFRKILQMLLLNHHRHPKKTKRIFIRKKYSNAVQVLRLYDQQSLRSVHREYYHRPAI